MNKKVVLWSVLGFCLILLGTGIFGYFQKRALINSSEEIRRKIILDNGLTVLFFKTTAVPKVFMQMTYNVGAAVEAADERGIAHVVEHMLFKGTDKLSEGDVLAIARKYGAYLNGQTSWDFTRYFFEVVKNNWRPFIPVFADLMQNARFDKQCFASEIKAIFQELNSIKDAKNKELIDRMFELSFPANHPYHFSVIGYKDELAKLTVERLRAFYDKYYRPDNAVFFMIGDFDIDEAIGVIRKNFESIKNKGPAIKKKDFPTVVPQCSGQYTRYSSNVGRAELAYYWIIPGLKDEDEVIPSLLEPLLYERFYNVLVKTNAVAYDVSTRSSKQLGAGLFMLITHPGVGKSEQCSLLVAQELKEIIKNGFTSSEIASVLKNKERVFYERMLNFNDFSYVWSKSYLATHDEALIFTRPELYKQGAVKKLGDYVQKYLNPLLTSCIEVIPLTPEAQALSKKIKKKEDALEKTLVKNIKRVTTVEGARLSKTRGCPQLCSILVPTPDRVITLPNGLKVILCKYGHLPLVSIDCGFINRDFLTASLDGVLVDVMLDMLLEPGDKAFDFFKLHGVSFATTATGVKLSMLHNNYQEVLRQLGLVLTSPKFSPEKLTKIKNRRINFYERCKGRPNALLRRTIKQVIYNKHPYGWSFDEAIAEIKNTTIKDLTDLYNKQVNAANMVVSIVGDFDLDCMQKTVEISLGSLPKVNLVAKKTINRQKTMGENRDIPLPNNLVMQALYASSDVTCSDHDFIPLKLLSNATFYRQGSRLFSLREEYGLFYGGFGGFAESIGGLAGFDYVGSNFSVGRLAEAESLLRAMIRRVGLNGISAEELDAAKQLYFMDMVNKLTSNKKIASLFSYLFAMNLGFDYYDKQLKRVEQISLDEVNRVAAKYFSKDHMFRIRIGRIDR